MCFIGYHYFDDGSVDFELRTSKKIPPNIEAIFNFTFINFGNLTKGTNKNPSIANYHINITISGGCNGRLTFNSPSPPLTSGSYSIANSNLFINYTINSINYPTLLSLDSNRNIDNLNTSTIYPKWYLDIPLGQYASSYSGSESITSSCI